jgi:hypothetical protein
VLSTRRGFQLLCLGLILVMAASCDPISAVNTPPTGNSASPSNGSGSQPADALLQVIAPNGTKGFSLSDLQKLPVTTITVDGKPQDGPALLEVLKAAGATDFKEVAISGTGSVTLSKD